MCRSDSNETNGWTVSILPDPLLSSSDQHHGRHSTRSKYPLLRSVLVKSVISLQDILGDQGALAECTCEGRGARVALADFFARFISENQETLHLKQNNCAFSLNTLDRALGKSWRRRNNKNAKYPPYVLERSDVWCSEDNQLHAIFRISVQSTEEIDQKRNCEFRGVEGEENLGENEFWKTAALSMLDQCSGAMDMESIMEHVACVAVQQRLRTLLQETKAVAFVANDSILPRKSGTSDAPMASPPAVSFVAPPDSSMSQTLSVEMGTLAKYLPSKYVPAGDSTLLSLKGLVIPEGVTLICGGGYHGKSTLLQTIAVGIYDKIPGDGREFCVAVPDAVSIRAEDGRYVNNCNISAFISNLPTPPGVSKAMDTTHFSTRDSSGSTSQAANVVEAIEMGATAFLVDEDISAANFMARDGRMRSLVMDESITPLLYRVNGLYDSHGISSVVVVGGVGDWLDVPNQVILLDKYVASDATKKAQSISYQFSYGHVQYAGRGVVHRLDWQKSGTPIPRRPMDGFSEQFSRDVTVSIMEGGHALSLYPEDHTLVEQNGTVSSSMSMNIDSDEDYGWIEASRLEQLLGRKQLFGCGLCALWILQAAPKHPTRGLKDLLESLDEFLDKVGMIGLLEKLKESSHLSMHSSSIWHQLVEEAGYAHRPRMYEVGQALTRMHGIKMEEIPVEEDDSEAAALQEAERKKQALLKIWENRRKK